MLSFVVVSGAVAVNKGLLVRRKPRGKTCPNGSIVGESLESPNRLWLQQETSFQDSAAKNYGFKRWRPDHGTSTDQYQKELTRWEKLLQDIIRK
jgi:hypothetical protein